MLKGIYIAYPLLLSVEDYFLITLQGRAVPLDAILIRQISTSDTGDDTSSTSSTGSTSTNVGVFDIVDIDDNVTGTNKNSNDNRETGVDKDEDEKKEKQRMKERMVLEIHLDKAWRLLQLEPTYRNEVDVEICFYWDAR